jgi:outer membrane biosynthesis protein TonB
VGVEKKILLAALTEVRAAPVGNTALLACWAIANDVILFLQLDRQNPVRTKFHGRAVLGVLAVVAWALWAAASSSAAATPRAAAVDKGADLATVSRAICPIVYPVDESPSAHGYQYIFYGNGFFISREGYLITAAHVLHSFKDGGQPHILVSRNVAPPQLLKAEVVAVDWQHDVALLRATPNPFQGNYSVGFLPLGADLPRQGQAVVVAALRPSKLRPHTFETALEDHSAAEVLKYQFEPLDKGQGDTELFLFNHAVIPGQSGAPILAANDEGVVGFVEGQWLHPVASLAPAMEQQASTVGVGVSVHYVLALLQQAGVSWRASAASSAESGGATGSDEGFTPPKPLSLVTPPYPAEALLGGEVLLDALVARNGMLTDIKVVSGQAPFLEKALGAARTWVFVPARLNGDAVETRIGIAFQFVQPYVAAHTPRVHNYAEPPADAAERGELPMVTVEPEYPASSTAEDSVILYEGIDAQGLVTSSRVVHDVESLTASATEAARQWHFAPGKHAGQAKESVAIVVVTFRQHAVRLATK